MNVGDKVRNIKGCRINGPCGVLTVIATGKKWAQFDAVTCEKPDGTKRLFLEKNLIPDNTKNEIAELYEAVRGKGLECVRYGVCEAD